jgi:hypothetical protein
MEKQFRQSSLKKGQDPDVWITELANYRMKLDELGSRYLRISSSFTSSII